MPDHGGGDPPTGYLRSFLELLSELRLRDRNPALRTIADRIPSTAGTRTSVGYISQVLRGQRVPSGDMAAALAAAMHGDTAEQMRARRYAEEAAADRSMSASPAASVIPHQLPAGTLGFTGRAAEIRLIVDAVGTAVGTGENIAVYAIDGMPGAGKTALAVHVARQLADQFPDGQFFVDLHAHSPERQPTEPAEALTTLLSSDGVDPRYIPKSIDDRAAKWRDRTASRRILLVLDNAISSNQVTPLLTGSSHSLVLITSRRYLGDLPTTALEIPLDVLEESEAGEMFTRLATRAPDDAAQVAQLVDICGRLPLAIVLLARVFAKHRSWTMDDLITAAKDRLLHVKAENRTVSAAFDLSYQHLSADQQRALRRIAQHPGTDIDSYAAAALMELPTDKAGELLDQLHTDRLISETAFGRYGMHDLIRQYTRGSAATTDDAEASVGRLLTYYAYVASRADERLANSVHRIAVPRPSTPTVELPDRRIALDWLRREYPNLLAAIRYAQEHDVDAAVPPLTAGLASFLLSQGPWETATTLHRAAADAAARYGDQRAEAHALLDLSNIQTATDYPAARQTLGHAAAIFHDIGDRVGEAIALSQQSLILARTGDPGTMAAIEQALATFRETGDTLGEAHALENLGIIMQLTSSNTEAIEILEQAQAIYQRLDNLPGQARVHNDLGMCAQAIGDSPRATREQQQAADLFAELDDRIGEADARSFLGAGYYQVSDFQKATIELERVLSVYRRFGDRTSEAQALIFLGFVRYMTADFDEAARYADQALEINQAAGAQSGRQQTLLLLGTIRQVLGDFTGATEALTEAIQIGQRTNGRIVTGNALTVLGTVAYMTGNYDEATTHLNQARRLHHMIGDPRGKANALGELAVVRSRTGDHRGARRALNQALQIFRENQDQHGEAGTLNHSGELHLTAGNPQRALTDYQQALQIARSVRGLLEEARAHEGIGHSLTALEDSTEAATHLRAALAIYQRIGCAETTALATALDSRY